MTIFGKREVTPFSWIWQHLLFLCNDFHQIFNFISVGGNLWIKFYFFHVIQRQIKYPTPLFLIISIIDKKIKKSEKQGFQPNFFISYPDFVGLQGFAIQFPTSNEFLVPFWPNLLEASHDGIRTPRPCICRSNKSVSLTTFLKMKICG